MTGGIPFETLVTDIVAAYAGDASAMERIREHCGHPATVEDLRAIVWRNVYKVRQAGGAAAAFTAAEAREMVARTAGFGSWTALLDAVGKGIAAPTHAFSKKDNKVSP